MHYTIFILFTISLVRFFIYKHTSYSAIFIGTVGVLQSIFNGCPVTTLNNYLATKAGGIDLEDNSFWGGMFGEYTNLFRVITFGLSLIILYYAYKTWGKVVVKVNPSLVFRKNLNSLKLSA